MALADKSFQGSPLRAFVESPLRVKNAGPSEEIPDLTGIIYYSILVTELVSAAYQWDDVTGWSGPLPLRMFGYSPTDFSLITAASGSSDIRQISSVDGDSSVCYWQGTVRSQNTAEARQYYFAEYQEFPPNPPTSIFLGWVDAELPTYAIAVAQGRDWSPGVDMEVAPAPIPVSAPLYDPFYEDGPNFTHWPPPGWSWHLQRTADDAPGGSHVGGDYLGSFWIGDGGQWTAKPRVNDYWYGNFSIYASNVHQTQFFGSRRLGGVSGFAEEISGPFGGWGAGGSSTLLYIGTSGGGGNRVDKMGRNGSTYFVTQTYPLANEVSLVDVGGGAGAFIYGVSQSGVTAPCQIRIRSEVDGAVLNVGNVEGGVRGLATGVGGKAIV